MKPTNYKSKSNVDTTFIRATIIRRKGKCLGRYSRRTLLCKDMLHEQDEPRINLTNSVSATDCDKQMLNKQNKMSIRV